MPGTVIGGQRAAETNKERYGDDFYKVQGAIGGSVSNPNKGFGSNRELARKAGRIGGMKSKRGPDKQPRVTRQAVSEPREAVTW